MFTAIYADPKYQKQKQQFYEICRLKNVFEPMV